MRLFEFETKALLLQQGITVPEGLFTNNPTRVAEFVEKTGRSVVKAQTLAGRRMEAGGIRFVDQAVQGELAAEMLFDKTIYNEEIIGVRVEEFIKTKKEYYVCFHYDSSKGGIVLSFSVNGGKQIESPDFRSSNLHHLPLPVNTDVEWRIRNFLITIMDNVDKNLVTFLGRLYDFFLKYEFTMLEINPLSLAEDGSYVVVDVVSMLDSSALGRHPELIIAPRVSRRNYSRSDDFKESIINIEDSRGVRTDFVHLGGDIATLSVGGALSLTVIDYIEKSGGKPYNYAELRPNASTGRIVHMLKTFLSSSQIKGLLIVGSVFGNMGLDSVANGIRNALKEIQPEYPIVLRVTGLGRELAKDISKGLQRLNMTVLRDETTLKQSVELIIKKAYGNTD
jgi:succinyl-CoA synthetase beta subunit